MPPAFTGPGAAGWPGPAPIPGTMTERIAKPGLGGDILAGIVVALALIPEGIGFSIIAGVDPRISFHASFSIAVIISLVGGRAGQGRMSILPRVDSGTRPQLRRPSTIATAPR